MDIYGDLIYSRLGDTIDIMSDMKREIVAMNERIYRIERLLAQHYIDDLNDQLNKMHNERYFSEILFEANKEDKNENT